MGHKHHHNRQQIMAYQGQLANLGQANNALNVQLRELRAEYENIQQGNRSNLQLFAQMGMTLLEAKAKHISTLENLYKELNNAKDKEIEKLYESNEVLEKKIDSLNEVNIKQVITNSKLEVEHDFNEKALIQYDQKFAKKQQVYKDKKNEVEQLKEVLHERELQILRLEMVINEQRHKIEQLERKLHSTEQHKTKLHDKYTETKKEVSDQKFENFRLNLISQISENKLETKGNGSNPSKVNSHPSSLKNTSGTFFPSTSYVPSAPPCEHEESVSLSSLYPKINPQTDVKPKLTEETLFNHLHPTSNNEPRFLMKLDANDMTDRSIIAALNGLDKTTIHNKLHGIVHKYDFFGSDRIKLREIIMDTLTACRVVGKNFPVENIQKLIFALAEALQIGYLNKCEDVEQKIGINKFTVKDDNLKKELLKQLPRLIKTVIDKVLDDNNFNHYFDVKSCFQSSKN